jgi:hypothetical protein
LFAEQKMEREMTESILRNNDAPYSRVERPSPFEAQSDSQQSFTASSFDRNRRRAAFFMRRKAA